MSVTEQTEHGDHEENSHEEHGHGGHYLEGGNHHDTPQEKHRKEHLALWLFIFGDVVFFLLELFFWFYLRANNTGGGWREANCGPHTISSPTNTCVDGLGNPITSEIAKAAPIHTIAIAVLIIVSAGLIWFAEVQARQGASRKTTTPLTAFSVVFVLAGLAWQFYQFQVLPFTTVDGAYASTFTFFMGSNVAHFLILLIVALGLFNRSRIGKFENGRWYQLHLGRLFAVWIALSCAILALVTVFFA